MIPVSEPARGDVWQVDLNPTQGREQSGVRPALVISVDAFNAGPADLVVVLPITSRFKNIPFHVEVTPPEGDLTMTSYIKCEDVRSVAKGRLMHRYGAVSSATLEAVADRLKILLDL